MPRKYQLKARAKRQEETRRRIVEAAIDLHRTVGPARTAISAVAERAGVQRHTLYRYFRDEGSLLKACSEHYRVLNPLPDPQRWLDIPNPRERLRIALAEAYAYYRRNEAMMANVLRDSEVMGPPVGAEFLRHRSEMLAVLAQGWGTGAESSRVLQAVLGLAVDFQTWRFLVRQSGLGDAEAIEVMVGLTEQAAGRRTQEC
jgi:AcrR family transcriptional regulator